MTEGVLTFVVATMLALFCGTVFVMVSFVVDYVLPWCAKLFRKRAVRCRSEDATRLANAPNGLWKALMDTIARGVAALLFGLCVGALLSLFLRMLGLI